MHVARVLKRYQINDEPGSRCEENTASIVRVKLLICMFMKSLGDISSILFAYEFSAAQSAQQFEFANDGSSCSGTVLYFFSVFVSLSAKIRSRSSGGIRRGFSHEDSASIEFQ